MATRRDRGTGVQPIRTTLPEGMSLAGVGRRRGRSTGLWRSRWAAIGAAIAVVAGVGGVAISGATNPQLVPSETLITPCRIMDTRAASQVGPRGTPLAGGETHTITVNGTNGNCTIPNDATGLIMNVTAVGPGSNGFITVFPGGATRPTASNLNYTAGQAPVPNQVTVAVGVGVSFFASGGPVNLIADIAGFTTRPRMSTEDVAELAWETDRSADLTLSSSTVGDQPVSTAFDGTSIWWVNAGTTDELRKVSADLGNSLFVFPTTVALAGCTNPSDITFGFGSIWVVCSGSNRVVRVNATTNAVEASNIAVGTTPNSVAANDLGVYVTNTASNNVSRINPGTNTVSETITLPGGAGPTEITRGRNRSSLLSSAFDMWVTNGSGNSVSRITTGNATSAVTTFTAGIGTAPSSITFDGRNVWVGVTDAPGAVTGAVLRMGEDGAVLATIDLGSSFAVPLDLVYDGSYIWAISPLTAFTTRIDPIGNTTDGSIEVGGGLGSATFDGRNLWATNSGTDQVLKLRTS